MAILGPPTGGGGTPTDRDQSAEEKIADRNRDDVRSDVSDDSGDGSTDRYQGYRGEFGAGTDNSGSSTDGSGGGGGGGEDEGVRLENVDVVRNEGSNLTRWRVTLRHPGGGVGGFRLFIGGQAVAKTLDPIDGTTTITHPVSDANLRRYADGADTVEWRVAPAISWETSAATGTVDVPARESARERLQDVLPETPEEAAADDPGDGGGSSTDGGAGGGGGGTSDRARRRTRERIRNREQRDVGEREPARDPAGTDDRQADSGGDSGSTDGGDGGGSGGGAPGGDSTSTALLAAGALALAVGVSR